MFTTRLFQSTGSRVSVSSSTALKSFQSQSQPLKTTPTTTTTTQRSLFSSSSFHPKRKNTTTVKMTPTTITTTITPHTISTHNYYHHTKNPSKPLIYTTQKRFISQNLNLNSRDTHPYHSIPYQTQNPISNLLTLRRISIDYAKILRFNIKYQPLPMVNGPLGRSVVVGDRTCIGSIPALMFEPHLDRGLGHNIIYPWYLLRTSLFVPSSPSVSAMAPRGVHHILEFHRSMRFYRNKYIWPTLMVILFFSILSDIREYRSKQERGPDLILANAIITPTMDIVTVNKKASGPLLATRPTLAKMALALVTQPANEFATLASDPHSVELAMKKFQTHQHETISSLLFSFYRTPVTESVRSQLKQTVLSQMGKESKKLAQIDGDMSSLQGPGRYTIAEVMSSLDPSSSTSSLLSSSSQSSLNLIQQVASRINNTLDDNSAREGLFIELMNLAMLRKGFESLLQHHNQTMTINNPSLMTSNLAHFNYISSDIYQPIIDTKNLSSDETILINNLSQVFLQCPIANFSNILSPDMQLALSLSIRYPALYLPYASVLVNTKSVLQDALPNQSPQTPITPKSPTPAAIAATQQLIPADLLGLYPVIQGDDKSLPLCQVLLLTDLAMGQLLGEYYRLSPQLRPLPPPQQLQQPPQQLEHQQYQQ